MEMIPPVSNVSCLVNTSPVNSKLNTWFYQRISISNTEAFTLGAKYLKMFEYIYLQFQFLMVIAKSRTFISLTKLCPQTLGNMLRCVSRMWQTGQSNVIAQFRVKLYSVSTLIVFQRKNVCVPTITMRPLQFLTLGHTYTHLVLNLASLLVSCSIPLFTNIYR